jgi:predicted nucleotidyltransferase
VANVARTYNTGPRYARLLYSGYQIMTDTALLEHITQTIGERFHPRRVILFGSHVRGEAQPNSDLDLFVEMETQARLPERSVEISSVFGLRPWSMDVVVYAPEEVQRLRRVHGTLLSVIEAEGKVL